MEEGKVRLSGKTEITIFNFGIHDSLNSEECEKIKMTNRVFVYSAIFSTIYGFYLLYLQHYTPSRTVFGMAVICALALVLNYKRIYTPAKLIYLTASNFCIYYFSTFLGMPSGVYLFVLLAPAIIFSFFSPKEIWGIVAGLGIYIVTFLIVIEEKFSYFISAPDILTSDQQHIFYVANIFFIFILSTVILIYLQNSNSSKNKELIDQHYILIASQKRLEEEIAEHKRAQERLGQSESRLAAALEAAQQGLWELNFRNNKFYFDKTWPVIMGIPDIDENENDINIITSYIHPEHVSLATEAYTKHLKGETSYYETEYITTPQTGEPRWIFARGKITDRDTSGKPIRMMGTIQDITVKKQFEEELKKAKQTAEKASLAKAQFLSVMSHEIRTPLNAVIGMTHLLIEDNPREDQLNNLNILQISSENLLVLINDVLDYSKIEAGKIEFEEIDFNLRKLIYSINYLFLHKAEEKSIELIIQLDKALPEMVLGDPTRTGQILTNLLSNAIKYTKKGKVILEGKINKEDQESVSIDFSVTDTGIGIEHKNYKYIFESFAQENSSITRKFGGTGLGLAITQRLLTLQKSEIKVESELGKGSKFSFTLPFKRAKAEPKIETRSICLEGSLNGIKVLLVEDNEMNILLTTKILKNAFMEVDVAMNGLEAIEKVSNKDYDIILMDLQMPDMDGYETTEIIRKSDNPMHREIPIIALTAEAFLETKNRAFTVGMTDYLTKPFNPKLFLEKIEKHVSKNAYVNL